MQINYPKYTHTCIVYLFTHMKFTLSMCKIKLLDYYSYQEANGIRV